MKRGPYNRHNYEIADIQTLPEVVKELLKVLTSDFMGLTLSNMTGLALHPTVPKTKSDETDSDDYSEDDDEEEQSEDAEQEGEFSDSETEILSELNSNSPNKRKMSECEENDGSKPCCSSSLNKKIKNDENLNENEEISEMEKLDEKEYGNPKYHCEVRRWKPGSYTLITDDDDEIKKEALDLMVYFGCQNWSLDCGGNVSYIARDEDTEVVLKQK